MKGIERRDITINYNRKRVWKEEERSMKIDEVYMKAECSLEDEWIKGEGGRIIVTGRRGERMKKEGEARLSINSIIRNTMNK